jgi:TrpR family trp operon transcriptional repressor
VGSVESRARWRAKKILQSVVVFSTFLHAETGGWLSHMETKDEWIRVFAEITDVGEMNAFLHEMFTPKEMMDIRLRWQLLKELHEGETQRSIASRHRMSLCKITRGAKLLKAKNSLVKKILDNMNELS